MIARAPAMTISISKFLAWERHSIFSAGSWLMTSSHLAFPPPDTDVEAGSSLQHRFGQNGCPFTELARSSCSCAKDRTFPEKRGAVWLIQSPFTR